MNGSYDTGQTVFMGIVSLITGIYGVWVGILGIMDSNMKIPGIYKFGIFISKFVKGKAKTVQMEADLDDPQKKMKNGILLLCFGILFLAAGIFFIFET
jgi:hypothetical protein